MKKVFVILTLVLFVGTLVAPAMQVFSNTNVVVISDDENPKDKKQDKSATETKADSKKDAKCDAKKDAKKDCATKCTGEKKPACCSGEKKQEEKK